MRRRIGFLMLLTLLWATPAAVGHHGYAEYDRESKVDLEGIVAGIQWVNPHVIVTLNTEGGGEYRIEWRSVANLRRQGVEAPPLEPGDRVVITGSVNRNPDRRIMTLLSEIARPSDGWRWVDSVGQQDPDGPR